MTPSWQPGEAELADVLRGLASQGLGIEKENLYEVLGKDLRRLWFIFPEDRGNKALVRQKADCHINHCIAMIDAGGRDPESRKALLRAAFNLKEVPESTKELEFTERLRALQSEPGDLKQVASYSTLDRMRDAEHVFERMAQAMLENPLDYGRLTEEIRGRFGVLLPPREETSEPPQPSLSQAEPSTSDHGSDDSEEEKKRIWWRPGITLTATGVPAILVALAIVAWVAKPFPFGDGDSIEGEGQESSTNSATSPSPSPTLESTPPSSSGVQNDCSVEGDNNNIECNFNNAPDYAEIAGVDLFFDYGSFVFAGPVEDLPTPPNFPLSEQRGHCDDWHDWVIQQDNFYIMYPTVVMYMETGVTELLVVNNLEVNVMDKADLPEGSVKIQCQRGAGLHVGYWAGYDTRTREGYFFNESGEEVAIPPASFSLQPGEYESAGIGLSSDGGKIYSGVLNISTRVDGEAVPVSFGDSDNPIRWYGSDGSSVQFEADELMPSYSWDVTLGEWVDSNSIMSI